MRIEIDSPDEQTTSALVAEAATTQPSAGTQPQIEVIHQPHDPDSLAKNGALADTIQILLSVGTGMALNIVSNWLYDLIKQRHLTLKIGGRVVSVDPQSIRIALEDEARKTGSAGDAGDTGDTKAKA